MWTVGVIPPHCTDTYGFTSKPAMGTQIVPHCLKNMELLKADFLWKVWKCCQFTGNEIVLSQ